VTAECRRRSGKRLRLSRWAAPTVAAGLAFATPPGAQAQLMEPRSYANVPVGLNFLSAGYGYLWGNVLTDPSLPVQDVDAQISTALLSYTRAVRVGGGQSLLVPYAWLSASGEVMEQARSVDRTGLADIGVRLSANLYGAPALSLRDYQTYRPDTIVGVSLLVTTPTGQYDSDRLINIGTNRWSFRPEVGLSKTHGRWTLETALGVTLFTDNDAFFGDKVRSQDPLYGVQAHLIYAVGPVTWVSVDATFYAGGATSLDGVDADDRQENSRFGATASRGIDRHNSIKAYVSAGATARFGTNFNTVGVAWQYRWGGGL
jgi:hypothetical protein